jgi:sugar phosphate isomerase/epimerase
MVKLSAFADEIGDDLDLQIATLKSNQVGNIELRGVWGKNVLDLSEAEIKEVKRGAMDAGLGFSAIGSPIGKFPLDGDFNRQLEALKKALDYAQLLEAPYIRIFSYYVPKGQAPARARPQVIDWLGRLIQVAEKTSVVLAHENEKEIYGDTGARCLDLYSSLKSRSFTGIFDFANFVQCAQRPYEDCWLKLEPYITYFHIKDALLDTGQVVPPGMGDGDLEKILREAYRAGYDNFLTLEPHLSLAEANYGRTSPELFGVAASKLKEILARIGANK